MLSRDFRDILSAFSDARVEYLLVGAYALSAHGLVRATGDIDLWVRPTAENAERVHHALLAFGAPAHLVANKRSADRPKDRLDLRWLEEGQAPGGG